MLLVVDAKLISPAAELYWLENDQILYVAYHRSANLAEMKEQMEISIDFFEQKNIKTPIRILSDVQKVNAMVSKEVRDYCASEEVASICKASAILVGGNFSKILGNMYTKFSKPPFPTKLFTNKEKALEWLRASF